MGKTLIKGGLIGGFIVFAWMMVSWMVLPWHCWTISSVQNETKVMEALSEGITKDGLYVLPNFCEMQKGDRTEMVNKLKKGPFAVLSVKRYGIDNFSSSYIFSFIVQVIGAGIITFLIGLMCCAHNYWYRVGCVALMGLLIGLLGEFPYWNWWKFPISYVGIEILDMIIGWSLAGFAIAAFTKPKKKK